MEAQNLSLCLPWDHSTLQCIIVHVTQCSQCGTPGSFSTPRVSPKLCIDKKKNFNLYLYTFTIFSCVKQSLLHGSQLWSPSSKASQWVFCVIGNVQHQQDVPECPSPSARNPPSFSWDLLSLTTLHCHGHSNRRLLSLLFLKFHLLCICICMWEHICGGRWGQFQPYGSQGLDSGCQAWH